MLNKDICFECHARNCDIESYPVIDDPEFKAYFDLDWESDYIWCYGKQKELDALTPEERKKTHSEYMQKKSNPFTLVPSQDCFPESCLFKEKYQKLTS